MNLRACSVALVLVLVLVACQSPSPGPKNQVAKLPDGLTIAILSDPHWYDAQALGNQGDEWLTLIDDSDAKFISRSQSLVRQAFAKIKAAKPNILLIPGDLSNNGERASHLSFAKELSALEQSGISVWIVNGNHDIRNNAAEGFNHSQRHKVDSIEPAEFASIYADFAYNQAYALDPNSLSWVAMAVPGLVIIGVDSCDYDTNQQLTHPRTGGRIKSASLAWINQQQDFAHNQGNEVLIIQHHGVVPHFRGQPSIMKDYLVDDYAQIGASYAQHGVLAVLTGHNHAMDVAEAHFNLEAGAYSLIDIQTGSMVSWPFAWRIARVDNQGNLNFQADSLRTPQDDVPDRSLVEKLYRKKIKSMAQRYGFDESASNEIARAGAEYFLAYGAGDETDNPNKKIATDLLGLFGNLGLAIIADSLADMRQDTNHPDLSFTLK